MQRIREFDSLRGIAAFTVVIHHFLLILPAIDANTYGQKIFWQVNVIKYTPLHLVWAGREAVIFFFVLSGFVLSLPFLGGKEVKYSHFLIKRVCRIYIPYFCAITIAIMLDLLLSRHGIPQLSGWFQLAWTAKVSNLLILNHYLLLGNFDNMQFDPVIWSLVQEMRISLFFPLLVYLAKRYDWKIVLGIGLALYGLIGYGLNSIIVKYYPNNDVAITARYVLMFVIGILLAKHWDTLTKSFKKIPTFFQYGLFLIALLFYVNTWLTFGVQTPYKIPVNELFVSAGVCILLIIVLASVRFSKILLYRPIAYLGKISYSLYLLHSIVLIACVNLLFGRLSLAVILSIAFITTFAISIPAYHFIELPSMTLGKYLIRKRDHSVLKRRGKRRIQENVTSGG